MYFLSWCCILLQSWEIYILNHQTCHGYCWCSVFILSWTLSHHLLQHFIHFSFIYLKKSLVCYLLQMCWLSAVLLTCFPCWVKTGGWRWSCWGRWAPCWRSSAASRWRLQEWTCLSGGVMTRFWCLPAGDIADPVSGKHKNNTAFLDLYRHSCVTAWTFQDKPQDSRGRPTPVDDDRIHWSIWERMVICYIQACHMWTS